MNRDIVRQLSVILAVAATIAVNGLANALPLNGQTTGEISDKFQVFFVPAGYVFSIWGLIYVGMILYAVYQATPAQRENPRLRRIGYLFVLSCLANVVWLFLWHYEYFLLTVVAMVSLLTLLIVIYIRLGIGQVKVPAAERWLVHLLFSVYLGWISVATIANITSVLDYLNWNQWGLSAESWTVIMLLVAVILAWAMSLIRGDVVYCLVLIWAFIGIAVKNSDTPSIATAAWAAAGLTIVGLIVGLIFKHRKKKTEVGVQART